MFNIIPLILILVSLSIIIIIVVKKFSVLASLDIETIQEEKEAKFKEQIIGNRLKRNIVKWKSRGMRMVRPIGQAIKNFFAWLHNKLLELKDSYASKATVEHEDVPVQVERLFVEAEELQKKDELDEAEKKYIEIIGLAPKNIKAFKLLGRLYFEEKNFGEAAQTFEHALKLLDDIEDLAGTQAEDAARDEQTEVMDWDSQRASIYLDLALSHKTAEEAGQALKAIKKALRLEPNNPRYLDTALELSIIEEDKF